MFDCQPVGDYHFSIEEQSSILRLQQSVLELVTTDSPDDKILEEICLLAERLLPDSVATLMTRQPAGHLDVLCAPSVPAEGVAELNGLIPCEHGGSCGNAVYQNKPMYVLDIHTDPRGRNTREALSKHGICACWSHPIRDRHSQAIGSFALSSFGIREPEEFHKQLLAICAHLCGIILERQRRDRKLELLAYSDPLTGLANRICLFEKITAAIAETETETETEGSTLALLFLDLDRFKHLNDTYGHSVGDDVLVMIAERMKEEYVGPGDVLSRVGGDEFVLLIRDAESIDTVRARATSLLDKIREPISYSDNRFHIDGSVGIAFYPEHGDTAETLIKHADTAMYEAKRYRNDKVRVYNSDQ